MKKVRFLTDLFDLETNKFYGYNEVIEVSDKKADNWFKKELVDILKEETKKETKPKKETKKKATKKDKEEKVDKK